MVIQTGNLELILIIEMFTSVYIIIYTVKRLTLLKKSGHYLYYYDTYNKIKGKSI